MRRNPGLVMCIRLGEVFLAAAGAFFFGQKGAPGILWHVLAPLRSSRLPQALIIWRKWRSLDFLKCCWGLPCCRRRLCFPLKMMFLRFYDMYQPCWGLPVCRRRILSAKMTVLRFYDMYEPCWGLPGCRRRFCFGQKWGSWDFMACMRLGGGQTA